MCSKVGAEHFPGNEKLANIFCMKTLAAPVPPLDVAQLCKPHSFEPFWQAFFRGIIREDSILRTKVISSCIMVWMVVFVKFSRGDHGGRGCAASLNRGRRQPPDWLDFDPIQNALSWIFFKVLKLQLFRISFACCSATICARRVIYAPKWGELDRLAVVWFAKKSNDNFFFFLQKSTFLLFWICTHF